MLILQLSPSLLLALAQAATALQSPADAAASPNVASFKLVQIGVWSRVAQDTTHDDDLAFVMKSMRQDMMKDERRSADGDVSIGEMKLCVGIELLIGQGRQICVGRVADVLQQEPCIGEDWAVLDGPVGVL